MTAQELVILALAQYRGDDLERAQRAFARYTPEQMAEPHGESGMSRAEVLAGYQAREMAANDALRLVKTGRLGVA